MDRRDSQRLRARDTVSEKIDHLFLSIRRPDGREFTYDEVECGTQGRVSRSYIWKLRHGRNRNPSLDVVEALAGFFQVPPSYFFSATPVDDDTARHAASVAALLQDDWTGLLVERTRGLSHESREAILSLVEQLRRIEGVRDT